MSTLYDVAVIGGGAAGMMAAIRSAEAGASVVVLEKNASLGKKILITGNGKCNYTNSRQGQFAYRGTDPAFAVKVVESFGHDETVRYFQKLGIEPFDKNGYFYPASGQASSVRDVLLMRLKYLEVRLQTDSMVRGIRRNLDDTFQIFCQNVKGNQKHTVSAKTVILTTGGKAAPSTGSTGDGYYWVEQLGIHCCKCVPALVGLHASDSCLSLLAGIRCQGTASAWVDGRKLSEDTGEIQYNKDGLSGIPILQISRFLAWSLDAHKDIQVHIRLLPEAGDLRILLQERFLLYGAGKTALEAMCGLLPEQMSEVLLRQAEIKSDQPAVQVSSGAIHCLADLMEDWPFHITSTCGFKRAQTTAGGICTDELDSTSMQSMKVPGLFAAGEVVDVDGICGGYNLQWAWSSGTVAGRAAAAYCGYTKNHGDFA